MVQEFSELRDFTLNPQMYSLVVFFVIEVSLFFFAVWSHFRKCILELKHGRICILFVPSLDKLGARLWRVVSSENDASGNEWKYSIFLNESKAFLTILFDFALIRLVIG